MKRSGAIATIAVFTGLLLVLSVLNLALPDREFSENENRYLAGRPALRASAVFSGKYSRDFETYFSDQFVGRDGWTALCTDFKRLLGNREINGVYLGKDGYYLQNTDLSDRAQFTANVAAVRGFFDRLSGTIPRERLSFLLAPTAVSVLSDRLPAGAPVPPENDCIDEAFAALTDYCVVDVRAAFSAHRQEEIYYKTDHHWTTRGAFLAYGAYCAAQKLAAPAESDYVIERVSDDFRGSLYSKVLARDAAYDAISLYLPKRPQTVAYRSVATTRDGLYDRAALEKKDQYLVFLGENEAEATLTTDAGTGRRLLVIKDSYANSFVPFLTGRYDSIAMLDLRYFRGSVDEYLRENGITDVLVLYNVANFASDQNLVKLTAD